MALFLALAQPVAAGDIFHFSGDVAFARWSHGGASAFVAAFDGSFQSPPGRPFDTTSVFLGLHEPFCDEAEDDFVVNDFFGFGTPDALTIDRQLTSTSVDDASLIVHGFQVRFDSCAKPDFDHPTFIDLGESDVSLSADWTGTGQLVRTRSSFAFDAGPDCKFSFRSHATSREATATGSVTRSPVLGTGPDFTWDLGTPDSPFPATLDFAQLASPRDMNLQIGNGC
jgi:hypothetical protein